MDRRERSGELLAGILALQDNWFSTLYVACPGIIQSFNPSEKTCVVQPTTRAQVMAPDATTRWVELPLLVDCPVQFPGGGGVTLTFPLKLGDECLVIFADRCIDAWWQNGGLQNQAELRLHDLSDGFVIPGVSSKPKVQTSISTTEAQLRTDDGTRKVRLNPTSGELELLVPGASVKLTDNRVDLTGTLYINGKPYLSHEHLGHGAGNYTDGVFDP